MGTGASVQAEQPRQQAKRDGEKKEEEENSKGKNQSKKIEIVTTYASVTPGSIIPQIIKKPEFRDALKNKDLSHCLHRKLRAAALGRKSACRVEIKRTGFTIQVIKICEGQVVTFHWNDSENKGFNVIQVVHDGEKHRAVVGGFNSGQLVRKGNYSQQFNQAGEYRFISTGVKCEPLIIEVHPRRDVESIVSDTGFEPHLIRLDEGNAVKWTWNDCEKPHKITEAIFNLRDQTLKPMASNKTVPTKTGSYRKEFNKPGLYYFQSGGPSPAEKNTCIVHVRERQREYKIDVFDNAFKPQILLIEEGDRVWWEWSKGKCLKTHCIYEAELPAAGSSNSKAFKQKKNGFKWQSPSKSGLMSHEFFKAGVYYYSDRGFDEAAEYFGTIIVKPAVVDHFIELTKGGFIPDMSHVKTGDRIWWTWLTSQFDQGSVVEEIEKCISPEGPASGKPESGGGTKITKELEGQKFDAGLELAQPPTVGVYHFYNHDTDSICSLVCNGGPKNHTIHVSDGGVEPSVVSVHPGDRVWWVWQDGTKQHNIIQTSEKGRVVEGGFCSGAPVPAPSAFMHQFQDPGPYYYKSEGTGKTLGIIWVKSQSQVHEIDVKPIGIDPDPKVVRQNDVVAWNFEDLVESDVREVKTDADVKQAESTPVPIIPRGCLNRVFPNRGVFHYAGTAFARPDQEAVFMDGHRVSTIIVDSNEDSALMCVDDQGFHPKEISVPKGKSVKWSWNGHTPHNIVHIKRPVNRALPNADPLTEVQGDKAFTSGPVIPSGSFTHTFDEPGVFFVVSEGAPSNPGIVTVTSDEDTKTPMPWIATEKNGGVVERNHSVKLCCDDPNASMFYTTDGSEPALHLSTTIPYNPQKGIELRNPGLQFIRAVAVSPGVPSSDVLTSKRFWVQGNENEKPTEPEEEQNEVIKPKEEMNELIKPKEEKIALIKQEEEQKGIQEASEADKLNWQKCTPTIKASFPDPGTMKVTWDAPNKEPKKLIAGYQLFLNGVSYSKMLKPKHNCATVTGLAGGRAYDVQLVACPNNKSLSPLESNIITMTSPKMAESKGPLISLETTAKPDTMSIVWMSLNSASNPVEGYRIYLNGHMCGNMIVPDATSNRCRVVIEGCNTGVVYKVKVAAIPPGGSPPKMSNELNVTLPLNVENIHVPEEAAERNEADEEDGKYSEFLTIKEDPAHEEKELEAKRLARDGKVNIEVKDDEDERMDPNALPPGDKSTSTAVMTVTPVLDSGGHLPVPVVTAEKQGDDAVRVSWKYPSSAEPMYHLAVSVVNVIGQKFRKNTNSDISFECMHDDNGNAVPAVQHSWNVTKDNSCIIKGLARGTTYSINVVANYALANTKHSYEVQTKSMPITYTTPATAQPSSIKILSLDPNKVTIGWENGEGASNQAPDPDIIGYQLLVDGQPVGGVMNRSSPQATLDKLQPGKTIKASIAPVTVHGVNPAEISSPIKISCPKKPAQPFIKEQPAYKRGSAMVAWENPSASEPTSRGDDVIFYRVYLDGKLHGEVKTNAAGNKNGYQYFLTDLTPGKTYDVSIKAFAGQSKIDPNSDQVFCLAESTLSNSIPITCPAPPESPQLRVDGMNSSGLEVSWDMPQQYGEATVSGYQMLKDGKLYGSIIPHDVHSLKLKGLTLGEKVDLQILALTDHAVGRDGDKSLENDGEGPCEIFIGDRYSACKPGPKLVVHYTGLVEAPSKVWCEQVTGHSAMIVWNKAEQPKQHFVQPDAYQVTWWPGERAEADIQSQSTKDDHMLISGLQPNTPYTFVVEARKMQKYSDINEGGDVTEDGYNNTFIMTAQSDHLHVQTASPPLPPSNLGIMATTCNSVQLAWDPPKERGTDIIGIRVDAIDMNSEDKKVHASVEVAPDATGATLENLKEKTDYLITVTAITSEFFDQMNNNQDPNQRRALSRNHPVPDDAWLPTTSVIVKTSGTESAADVRVIQTTPDSITLEWDPAKVHGSNRLQGTVVRWTEFKPGQPPNGNEAVLAYHRSVQADANRVTIDGLEAGIMYKFVVEAVVSIKTTLELGKSTDVEMERNNRRTTHVMSKPVVARTRAPCEPPRPLITGFTMTTVNLYWEKPLMHLLTGKDLEGKPKHVKLSLQGYRLEINGKPHMRLSPEAQSCTLIKCKPGKTYKIVLVAITCTADANKMRKKQRKVSSEQSPAMNREWKPLPEDFDNDESPSEPLSATLPNLGNGFVGEENVKYVMPPEKLNEDNAKDDPGNVLVQWLMQGDCSNIRQYNVTWKNLLDGSVQHRCLDPDIGKCTIPVTHRKAIYDIVVEPKYNKDTIPTNIQHLQVLVPGSPDPPEIWIKSVDDKEFVVEWSEPNLYGIKVDGYQVFVNDKRVGNPLSSHHRKAVIPCKPNRQYKINLVALSNDHRIPNSEQSNSLLVNTGPSADPSIEYAPDGDDSNDTMTMDDENELHLRVVRIEDSSIHLDWTQYQETPQNIYYRVVWSSSAQPAEREVRLPAGEKSCVLHKCYPGTNHFVRLYAVGADDVILDKSRQLTIQTSAAPEPPTVSIRAVNFNYIAIQWEKPTTFGDAAIVGYKIYVNGVVETVLGPDQFSYSFTHGQWCHEYVFQVQAVTNVEKLASRPSDPLVLVWPGVLPPVLQQVSPTTTNTVKIVWDVPYTTEGVKIKQLKLIVLEDETERVIQNISPIHPDKEEVEIHNLKQGEYLVYLEIYLHGTPEIVRSDTIKVSPIVTPEPPQITVSVTGLEERRLLEKKACDLLNIRDRLLNVVNSKDYDSSSSVYDEQAVVKAAYRLTLIEDMLDDFLKNMTQNYTGHLLVQISWTCPQSNPNIQVNGYKLLVDGKQYGETLRASVKTIRIKLGVGHKSHRVSLVCVSEHPSATSAQSNVVEVLTDPFLPFSVFSFLNQAPRNGKYRENCLETLSIERKFMSKRPINQGLVTRKAAKPPPQCTVMDILTGEVRPLMPSSGDSYPTAVLFWSTWCEYSKKFLTWFVRFAKAYTECNSIAVACDSSHMTATDRQKLAEVITELGCQENNSIHHITSQTVTAASTKAGASDLCELFEVVGLPTVVIIHPQNYVAWRGRYYAFDYDAFEHFMRYVLAQVMGQNSLPNPDPWEPEFDMDSSFGSKKRLTNREVLSHQPSTYSGASGSTTVHQRSLSAKQNVINSAKKPRREEITVNPRPFSASRSPYEEKLARSGSAVNRSRKAKSTF